ncbi:MAG TPA: PEP-CTERM sorting domain-containing protein [Phycisphaerae bacterium]|nr:PEP-CTERM sorting domain-containing protein [Phycisphaerae bacterium]
MEIEEDNVTQQTRARMYLRGGTPSAWTDWQDHDPGVTYAGTEGQVFGWIGGDMQFDNWYITGEGAPPAGNPGDANNDSVVSADDYGSVQLHFGDTGAVNIPGDANLDGVVSADDYGSVQLHFGTSYGGGAPVPEPGTMLLLTISGVALIRRRRS